MSDFLTSLAARTGPSAEAVQPRLPSLFEPKRLGVASLVNARSEATEQEEHVQEERPSNYERSTVQRRARLDSLTDRRQETAVESAKKPAPISGRSHPASFPARAEVGTQPFAAVIPRSAEPQHPATLSSQGQPAVSFESKKEVEPRSLANPMLPRADREVESNRQRVTNPKAETEKPPRRVDSAAATSEHLARLVKSLIPPRSEPRSEARRNSVSQRSHSTSRRSRSPSAASKFAQQRSQRPPGVNAPSRP